MPNDLRIAGNKGKPTPPEGGGVIIIACDVPAKRADQMAAGRLEPRVLVFEQVSGDLTAGAPVQLPVRELTPVDVLVMAQREIAAGRIVPAIAFQIPEQLPSLVKPT